MAEEETKKAVETTPASAPAPPPAPESAPAPAPAPEPAHAPEPAPAPEHEETVIETVKDETEEKSVLVSSEEKEKPADDNSKPVLPQTKKSGSFFKLPSISWSKSRKKESKEGHPPASVPVQVQEAEPPVVEEAPKDEEIEEKLVVPSTEEKVDEPKATVIVEEKKSGRFFNLPNLSWKKSHKKETVDTPVPVTEPEPEPELPVIEDPKEEIEEKSVIPSSEEKPDEPKSDATKKSGSFFGLGPISWPKKKKDSSEALPPVPVAESEEATIETLKEEIDEKSIVPTVEEEKSDDVKYVADDSKKSGGLFKLTSISWPKKQDKESSEFVEDKSIEESNRDVVLTRVETEKRLTLIQAWEESEKCKAENKAQRKLSIIVSAEKSKKAEVEAEIRKIEEKLETMKAEYIEKLKNKEALIHKIAEEKRAAVEAKRSQELLTVEETAAKYRATCSAPKKLLLGYF